jgi:TusA-related sulfurtransferase
MDFLEIKQRYENMTDDEILRVWADRDGVSDDALSLLSEELAKRKLLADPENVIRVEELKKDLLENQRKYERGQKRILWRVVGLLIMAVLAVLGALRWLLSK